MHINISGSEHEFSSSKIPKYFKTKNKLSNQRDVPVQRIPADNQFAWVANPFHQQESQNEEWDLFVQNWPV